MPVYLLDASVLIALTSAEHEHHARATVWASEVRRFAVCPVVEGALVRFVVRMGGRVTDAQATLAAVRTRRGYEFWPDSESYHDIDLDHVRGHRQVTDAYLLALVKARRGARLATLDEGLARAVPELSILIPM